MARDQELGGGVPGGYGQVIPEETDSGDRDGGRSQPQGESPVLHEGGRKAWRVTTGLGLPREVFT